MAPVVVYEVAVVGNHHFVDAQASAALRVNLVQESAYQHCEQYEYAFFHWLVMTDGL